MVSSALREAVGEIYVQVGAPDWAAPNLDGLADILRDLSWLTPGEVHIALPDLGALSARDAARLLDVVRSAVDESAGTSRSIHLAGAR